MKFLNLLLTPVAALSIFCLTLSQSLQINHLLGFADTHPQSATFSSESVDTSTYCTAIRGNGELIASHWVSLARIIEEEEKIPVGGAGGSSASITMFVLESLMQSPLVYKSSSLPAEPLGVQREGLEELQELVSPEKLAFVFKALPKHFAYIFNKQVNKYELLKIIVGGMTSPKEMSVEDKKKLGELEEIADATSVDDDFDTKNKPGLIAKLKRIRIILKQLKSLIKDADHIVDDYYMNTFEVLDGIKYNLTKGPLIKLVDIIFGIPDLEERNSLMENIKLLREILENGKESKFYYGSFDAQKDVNLFFRPGLLSFKKAGKLIDKLLAFYNHTDLKNSPDQGWALKMHTFFKNCPQEIGRKKGNKNYGELWFPKGSDCDKGFHDLLAEYYSDTNTLANNSHYSNIDNNIGTHLAAVSTTAVIKSYKGIGLTKSTQTEYYNSRKIANNRVKSFKISFEDDLGLGYWLPSSYKIDQLRTNLHNSDDLKSKKFMYLGQGSWDSILSTSPAEPGLTNPQAFTAAVNGKELISVGGWSDLHPVLVLKQLKDSNNKPLCDKVTYITRTFGESNFNQKIVLRLIGLKDQLTIKNIDHECVKNRMIDPNNEAQLANYKGIKNSNLVFDWTAFLNNNNQGCIEVSEEALESPWGRMSYWWNKKVQSSFTLSTKSADKVFCTDWNNFNVFTGEAGDLLVDTYYKSRWRPDPLAESDSLVGCW